MCNGDDYIQSLTIRLLVTNMAMIRCCHSCVQLKTGTGILSKLKKPSKKIGHFGFSISYTSSDGRWRGN